MLNTNQIRRGVSFGIGFGTVALILVLLIYASHIFLMLFTAILIAVFLNGLTMLLRKWVALSPRQALFVVIFVITGILVALGFLTGPRIAAQIDKLIRMLPESLKEIRDYLEHSQVGQFILSQAPRQSGAEGGGFSLFRRITGFFSSTVNVLVSVFIVLILGIYGAIEYPRYNNSLMYLVGEDKQGRLQEVLQAILQALRWWLIGRFAMMVIVGILTGLGLWILGVPLALSLGFIAFLFAFVPFIGPLLSAIPAVMIALLEGVDTALYVVILYILVQSLESYFITPWVQNRTVFIPLTLLITGQVLMGFLVGIVGILIATPLILVLILLVQILYVEGRLGYEVQLMGDHKK